MRDGVNEGIMCISGLYDEAALSEEAKRYLGQDDIYHRQGAILFLALKRNERIGAISRAI